MKAAKKQLWNAVQSATDLKSLTPALTYKNYRGYQDYVDAYAASYKNRTAFLAFKEKYKYTVEEWISIYTSRALSYESCNKVMSEDEIKKVVADALAQDLNIYTSTNRNIDRLQ